MRQQCSHTYYGQRPDERVFSLGYLHVTTCSWLCAQCQPCATPEALSETAFPTDKIFYARDKNVCRSDKLRLHM